MPHCGWSVVGHDHGCFLLTSEMGGADYVGQSRVSCCMYAWLEQLSPMQPQSPGT